MLNRWTRRRAAIEAMERRVLLSAITGQVYNDVNANGAHDTGEPGLPLWTVYLDQNNNGTFDTNIAKQTVASTDVPHPIPDPGSVTSTAVVSGLTGAVTHVSLTFNITHSFDSDLQLTLISPAGTKVLVVDQVGGSGQNFTNTTLDDFASVLIDDGNPPFPNVYAPDHPLSTFNGESPNGTWTLQVTDTSPGDSGTLNSWSLTVTTGEPNTRSAANGTYAFKNLAAGAYNVREVLQNGWTQTQPAGNGAYTLTLDGTSNASGNDFGNHQPPGAISGAVYNDLNSNGTQDAGEAGLAGRTVYIDANNNNQLDTGEVSTVTDAAGNWLLPAPVSATYSIRQVQQPGWVQTQPAIGLMASANVNISRSPGNQAEGAIAVNPNNPQQLFMMSNEGQADALFVAYSSDGGTTWAGRDAANGSDLPAACCDPSVSWDEFGNLFMSYVDSTLARVVLARSTDGGKTFTLVKQFSGDVDQPTTVTGAGSVWITWNSGGSMVATGANVTGLGEIGTFTPIQTVNGPAGSFGDIAIGPSGQLLETYQDNVGGQGPSTLYESLDPDGTGPMGFQPAVVIGRTNVGGFDHIPPQESRSVDAEVGLAWDRTSGPHAGRLYLVYTDETPTTGSGNTDIYLRHSDDAGATWSPPERVNDDATTNSQFLPRMALDQTTGDIALSWYDARNDLGTGGSGDTNGLPNDDAEVYATASTDGGQTFLPNVRVSAGANNAGDANNGIDLGDYTGLAFQSGTFYPLWSDNSNSTGDNPDGTLTTLDMYVARVSLASGAGGGFYSVFAGPGSSATGLNFGNHRTSVPGDANGDGRVDFADLLILAQNYGRVTGKGAGAGDFNNDGTVNFADLLILAQNYGAGTTAATPVGTATPASKTSVTALEQDFTARRRPRYHQAPRRHPIPFRRNSV